MAFVFGFGSDPGSIMLDVIVVVGIAAATFFAKRAVTGRKRLAF